MTRCLTSTILAVLLGAGSAFAQAKATAQNVPEIPYDSVPNFIKMPAGMYLGEAIGVATNSRGHVFVYTRSANTRLFEFDQNGVFVREIGEGAYNFDCSGFIDYALAHSVPAARNALPVTTSTRPLAKDFEHHFRAVGNGTAAGPWRPVTTVPALRPGDVIAWLQGNGRSEIYPYRLNYKNRQRIGGFYSLNSFGAWDSAMRVHWDDEYAQSVGARRAYDYGMLRNAWIMQMITDWMGDDAILVKVDDRISGFNVLGDLTRLTGSVLEIDTSGNWPEVVCFVECTNQLDETTASGTVRVRLPSRKDGLPQFPEPPAEHGLLPGMAVPEEGPWAR